METRLRSSRITSEFGPPQQAGRRNENRWRFTTKWKEGGICRVPPPHSVVSQQEGERYQKTKSCCNDAAAEVGTKRAPRAEEHLINGTPHTHLFGQGPPPFCALIELQSHFPLFEPPASHKCSPNRDVS